MKLFFETLFFFFSLFPRPLSFSSLSLSFPLSLRFESFVVVRFCFTVQAAFKGEEKKNFFSFLFSLSLFSLAHFLLVVVVSKLVPRSGRGPPPPRRPASSSGGAAARGLRLRRRSCCCCCCRCRLCSSAAAPPPSSSSSCCGGAALAARSSRCSVVVVLAPRLPRLFLRRQLPRRRRHAVPLRQQRVRVRWRVQPLRPRQSRQRASVPGARHRRQRRERRRRRPSPGVARLPRRERERDVVWSQDAPGLARCRLGEGVGVGERLGDVAVEEVEELGHDRGFVLERALERRFFFFGFGGGGRKRLRRKRSISSSLFSLLSLLHLLSVTPSLSISLPYHRPQQALDERGFAREDAAVGVGLLRGRPRRGIVVCSGGVGVGIVAVFVRIRAASTRLSSCGTGKARRWRHGDGKRAGELRS
jgi:hypothetical protein